MSKQIGIVFFFLITAISGFSQKNNSSTKESIQPPSRSGEWRMGRDIVKGKLEDTNYTKYKFLSRNKPENKGLFLVVDTSEIQNLKYGYKGFNCYISNATDSIVSLQTAYSRLPLIGEAYIKKKWRAIELIPSAACIYSYSSEKLDPNEYIKTTLIIDSGKVPTKIRYRLEVIRGQPVYSNAYVVNMNKKRLRKWRNYDRK